MYIEMIQTNVMQSNKFNGTAQRARGHDLKRSSINNLSIETEFSRFSSALPKWLILNGINK